MLDRTALERALADAHIPTLMMVLVHLSGDARFLDSAPALVYDALGDGNGGLTPEYQAEIRRKVLEAAVAHDGKAVLAKPSEADLRKMMDYIAGAAIPDHYVPYLKEELVLDGGGDPKLPPKIAPKLKGRDLKVLIIGAGMSGMLTAIRLQQAGIAFVIVDKIAAKVYVFHADGRLRGAGSALLGMARGDDSTHCGGFLHWHKWGLSHSSPMEDDLGHLTPLSSLAIVRCECNSFKDNNVHASSISHG